MAEVNLPITSRSSSDDNDFADVYSNDAAIIAQVNGNLDNTNISASAGIAHSKLANSTAGYLLIANSSGVITGTAASGAVSISSAGATSIGYFQDTQTADLTTADGVLTGISITPGAGTYFAFATARIFNTETLGTLHLRVNGVNVISGPAVGANQDADLLSGANTLVAMGVITPTAGQAVEVYGDFGTGTIGFGTIDSGRLVLVRLA